MQIRAIQSILEKIVPGVFEKILRKILARVVTLSSLCILEADEISKRKPQKCAMISFLTIDYEIYTTFQEIQGGSKATHTFI